MARRYNKRSNYHRIKKNYKRHRNSRQKDNLEDFLSNKDVLVFISKIIITILLIITVVGGVLFAVYKIWHQAEWLKLTKIILTAVTVLAGASILYGAYHFLIS
ncbi:MAG: hypothetical protein OXF49_01435 [Candidatus Saccharibacteria bacterium]|nr:hypothetical protein [Candidatus Saccharibacteria bacterium]